MKVFTSKLLAGCALLAKSASALQKEDAGVLDFVVETAGHGVIAEAAVIHTVADSETQTRTVLTTDDGSSCYVASRTVEDGTLQWRRNVCRRPGARHAFSVGSSSSSSSSNVAMFFTMDSTGLARGWNAVTGSLAWEVSMPTDSEFIEEGDEPGVWAVGEDYLITTLGGQVRFLLASDGSNVGNGISTAKALGQQVKKGENIQWIHMAIANNSKSVVQGIVAFVEEDGTTKKVWAVSMEAGKDAFSSTKAISAKQVLNAASAEIQLVNGSLTAFFLTDIGSIQSFSMDGKTSNENPASAWNREWSQITAIHPTSTDSMMALQGMNSEGIYSMGLFQASESGDWKPLVEATNIIGFEICTDAQLAIAIGSETLQAFNLNGMSPFAMTGDLSIPNNDSLENISVLECSSTSMTVLLSTPRGTTNAHTFFKNGDGVHATVGWSAEEGLSSASSAIVLDASHLGSDDLSEEQEIVATKLSLSARLSSQLDSIMSMLSTAEGGMSRRDHIFGFVKIAVLMSQKNHRLWGVATSGDKRGSIRWSIDLPETASWHTMVHGTTNSPNALHGINGGVHSREILVVSASDESVQWKCIDGTSGSTRSEESLDIASPIVQVIPIYGSTGTCHQASLLLHADKSMTAIPNDSETKALAMEQMSHAPNGMYAHVIDKASSKLESYQVAHDNLKLTAAPVGRTSFSGEQIVKVTYPLRDEMIQTMTTILGDNSLLLKYINPHLAVIVTVTNTASQTNIAQSLEKTQGSSTQKRKPVGVGESAAAEDASGDENVSNLFVNLVDTVSGRILHRTSHANADVSRDVSALISENWVIYSFVNAKTRRTEIGVLTLHEGMIDPKGIGMFTSPEQTATFSSFDARESKPVVLSKTYTFPKYITALGVTSTRGGISNRSILIASDDGKITSVSRMMLETRRPMGEVKDAEKVEGLFPYNELIIQVPFSIISHSRPLESVTNIVSAPTALESQSLVLAFGGPDIFFSRTSPSKGFDLLPDNFSRILVSIVSVGIVIVLFVVRSMGSKKAQKNVWL